VSRDADVVVIGGGVVGASIALEVARHGLGRVVLVDKAPGPGEGSTGASSSICRTRYTHPAVVRLAIDGLDAYRRWAEYLRDASAAAAFVETGVLWIADRSHQEVASEVQRLQALGAGACLLDGNELTGRFPAISPCAAPLDWDTEHHCQSSPAFLFEDRAGYIDPMDALTDLLASATSSGVDLRFSTEVVGLDVGDSGVRGVRLADGGSIAAGLVVNAAGPWCNPLNAMAGVEHRWSFVPTRIQTLYRPWPVEEAGEIPVTIDVATGVYVRPERASSMVWIGSVREEDEREEVADPDEFARSPSAAFRDTTLAAFSHRIPAVAARGTVAGIAGLYTINRQDVHPVVGPSGVDGFWLANGFSGHGFKLAPMIGSMIAQALGADRHEFDTTVPMSLFAIDRDPIGVDAKNVLA
jgi:sarcosine oxidase, subunit beta